MMGLAREIIGTQHILAAFLAIGLGYLVGQINLGGFSLGVGAVPAISRKTHFASSPWSVGALGHW